MKHLVKREHLLEYIKVVLEDDTAKKFPDIVKLWTSIRNTVLYQGKYQHVELFDLDELGVTPDSFYEWFVETYPKSFT